MITIELPLAVRPLVAADLEVCGWAGTGPVDGLDRARRGVGDYLAVCPPSGLPVALGGIDWVEDQGAGTLYQLHVHEALRSLGIGALLVGAAEQRIRDRGLVRVEIGVDAQQPRPAVPVRATRLRRVRSAARGLGPTTGRWHDRAVRDDDHPDGQGPRDRGGKQGAVVVT